MKTNKLGVLECLDKYEVACGDEDVVTCLDEGVLAYLDNNDKDNFDVDFIHAHPLKYFLEKYWLGNVYTYFHFCYQYNYDNQIIYHYKLNDEREKGWSET